MALKRTIIPITPYQTQNDKSDPSSCQHRDSEENSNSDNLNKQNKEKENRNDQYTDSKHAEPSVVKQGIAVDNKKQITSIIDHETKESNQSEGGETYLYGIKYKRRKARNKPKKRIENNNSPDHSTASSVTESNSISKSVSKENSISNSISKENSISEASSHVPLVPPPISHRHVPYDVPIHPDLTIDQIKNPRPVQRRKSCFVVGNTIGEKNSGGETLEMNTVFDKVQEKLDRPQKPARKKSKGRRQSFILIADSPQLSNSLIVMEVQQQNPRKRRKSMPFLETLLLDDSTAVIDSYTEADIHEIIQIAPPTTFQDDAEMEIDALPDPDPCVKHDTFGIQDVKVNVNDNEILVEKEDIKLSNWLMLTFYFTKHCLILVVSSFQLWMWKVALPSHDFKVKSCLVKDCKLWEAS